jgi:hypothetical protein
MVGKTDRIVVVGIYNYKLWFYNSHKNILVSKDMNDISILDLLVSLDCLDSLREFKTHEEMEEFINYQNI